MTTPYEAYTLYMGLKTHFNSKSYDYFRYHGKTNVKKETFLNGKHKYHFQRLSRKYNQEELKELYISNFLKDKNVWVLQLLNEEATNVLMEWKKYNQSLTYNFKNEVEELLNSYSVKQLFALNENSITKIIEIYKSQEIKISFETLCILCELFSAFELWKNKELDDLIYPEIEMKIKKYLPFISYDKKKIVVIMKELLDK